MYGWDLFGGLVMALVYDLATVIGWRRMSGSVSWPWRYEVGGEGIGIHTPQTDAEVRWDGIRRIRTRRDAWVLKLATGATVPVPRAAFSTEDAARIDERFATLVST